MTKSSSLLSLLFGASWGALAAPALAGSPLTDLGAGYGWGINDAGQAILSSGLYSSGSLTPTGLTGSLAINAAGQVAGQNALGHASIYENGTSTDLGLMPGAPASGGYTEASAINAGGQVVGYGTAAYRIDAFFYGNGAMTDIGSLPGAAPVDPFPIYNEAYGINDSGAITGLSLGGTNAPSDYHAYVYQNGAYTDLGFGEGFAINNQGQVTGVLSAVPSSANGNGAIGHAFLYGAATTTDLGTLPGGTESAGYAINGNGFIVGYADYGSGPSNIHAMVYNGVMSDLNSFIDANDPLKPYVTLTTARGINATGLVLANGVDSRTGLGHAYLLQSPGLAIAPGPLAFAPQDIGTVSAAQTVTLSNVGAVSLGLGQAAIDAGPFAIGSNSCGTTLAAGATCSVAVTFNPTSAGTFASSLTVTSDGVPFSIPLSGAAPVTVTLTASTTSVIAGTPFVLSWTVSPGASCQTSGGTSGDGWSGNTISGTGSQSITEAAVNDYAFMVNCTAGSLSANANVAMIVNYPAVTVTVGVSTSDSGQTVTLTWSSTNANGCTASGGSAGDGWAGDKAVSGSATLTEPAAPAGQTETFTFSLTCSSSDSGNSAQVSKSVHASTPPSSGGASGGGSGGSGGGGALDLEALLLLLCLGVARGPNLWLRRVRPDQGDA